MPLVLAGTVACFGAVAFFGIGMSRWYDAKRKAASVAFIVKSQLPALHTPIPMLGIGSLIWKKGALPVN